MSISAPPQNSTFTLILQCAYHWIGFNWIYMHFLFGSIFVPIHTFVVNQKLSQICTLKLRLLITQTRFDSDCTQIIWTKIGWVGALSSTSRITPAQFQMMKLQKDLKLRSTFNTKNYLRGRKIQVKTLKRLKVNEAVLMRLWESIVCRLGVAERQDHKAAYQRCLAR